MSSNNMKERAFIRDTIRMNRRLRSDLAQPRVESSLDSQINLELFLRALNSSKQGSWSRKGTFQTSLDLIDLQGPLNKEYLDLKSQIEKL